MLLFILCLFLVSLNAKKELSLVTDLECVDTPQCLSLVGNTWCQSGLSCINRRCHRQINTPCHSQTQICHEDTRQCLPKRCTASRDCDDGLFCNGHEKCVNGTCQVGAKACRHGHCNETLRECVRSNRLGHWRSYAESGAVTVNATDVAATGHSENQLWIGYLVMVVIILFMLMFVFLLMALVRRNDVARQYY